MFATSSDAALLPTMADLLKARLKELIVRTLKLDGVAPADLADNAPLFGAGLDLDSIDALELVLALKKKYGVVLEANDEKSREHLRSVASLAALIKAHT